MGSRMGIPFAGPFSKNKICVAKSTSTSSGSLGAFGTLVTALTFDTLLSSNPGWWNSSVNPSRLTLADEGLYLYSHTFIWGSGWGVSATGRIRVNGSRLFGTASMTSISSSLTGTEYFNAGDYIELIYSFGAGADGGSASMTGYSSGVTAQSLTVIYLGKSF